jgi:hypothetical protein
MMTDYSHESVDAALPNAKRYCMRDGRIWIMKRTDGRFEIINPYCKDVEHHYKSVLGWTVAAELTLEVKATILKEDG